MPSSTTFGRRVAITNLAKRSLVFSLNSRETVHLAPGATSAAISEHEVTNNPDIAKLRERAWVDVVVQDAGDPDRARADKKTASRDK